MFATDLNATDNRAFSHPFLLDPSFFLSFLFALLLLDPRTGTRDRRGVELLLSHSRNLSTDFFG